MFVLALQDTAQFQLHGCGMGLPLESVALYRECSGVICCGHNTQEHA